MKRLLIFVSVLLICVSSYGQRSGRYDTTFLRISDVKSRVDRAVGWANQGNGKWESGENKIPYILTEREILAIQKNSLDKDEGRRNAQSGKAKVESRKLGRDNFKSFEMREVVIKEQLYKIFIIKKLEGEFEFPVIGEGFRTKDVMEYYVFKASKLDEMFPQHFEYDRPYMVSLNAFTSGVIPYYEDKDYIRLISTKIQTSVYKSQAAGYSITNLIIALEPVIFHGKKLMRFNFIRSYPKKYVFKNYAFEQNAQELFDHFYYEMDLNEFRDFMGKKNPALNFDIDPVDFEGWYQRGLYQYEYGDYYGAIESFDEALRIWPSCDLFMLYAQRANAKHKICDFHSAITDYNTALSLNPKQPDEYETWVRSYYNRGVSKYNLNDVYDACIDWEKARKMGLEDAELMINYYCR